MSFKGKSQNCVSKQRLDYYGKERPSQQNTEACFTRSQVFDRAPDGGVVHPTRLKALNGNTIETEKIKDK